MHITSIMRINNVDRKVIDWGVVGGVYREASHLIVFKSQQGLDYELNYKYLTSEEHRGDKGPHLCRETDLKYKKELQSKLKQILTKKNYSIEELIEILGLKEQQANRAFKKLLKANGIPRTEVIKKLMGGRFY